MKMSSSNLEWLCGYISLTDIDMFKLKYPTTSYDLIDNSVFKNFIGDVTFFGNLNEYPDEIFVGFDTNFRLPPSNLYCVQALIETADNLDFL